jgi:hypothetical protein
VDWKSSVLASIMRLSRRKGCDLFTRQELIEEELTQVADEVGSVGATPAQTMSRILQELRVDGVISFESPGVYRLLRPKI